MDEPFDVMIPPGARRGRTRRQMRPAVAVLVGAAPATARAAVDSGNLRMAAYARFDLHLPTDDVFLRTELTHADDHRIVAVEGGVTAGAEAS